MPRRCNNRKHGVSLVEFVAATVIGLPMVMSMLYVILEANYLFAIRTNLDLAARSAAKQLADDYGKTGSTATNPDAVTPTISIPHFVDPTADQWTVTFNTTAYPPTVTVTCMYPTAGSKTGGLSPFPHPDPLHLGNSFNINATATFPLPH